MTRSAILLMLAACADHELGLGEPEAVGQGRLVKPTPVMEVDALVREINRFDSNDAYLNDVIDTRFSDAVCDAEEVREIATRRVTRDSNGRLRKLVLSWTSSRNDEKQLLTTHEAYHYDAAGALRVVVVDRETNHANDAEFVKEVETHNDEVARMIARMSTETEAQRIAIARMGRETRTATTITQYRAYFADGRPIYESRRDGLELARAKDYPDIPQDLPTLYGDAHPANVTSVPYLLALAPKPRYSAHELPEREVTALEPSIRTELIAYDIHDGERSLRTKPACR